MFTDRLNFVMPHVCCVCVCERKREREREREKKGGREREREGERKREREKERERGRECTYSMFNFPPSLLLPLTYSSLAITQNLEFYLFLGGLLIITNHVHVCLVSNKGHRIHVREAATCTYMLC